MPWIIDYPVVLEQMKRQGCRCLYYNSGAFGFADAGHVKAAGWLIDQDPTLRPQAALAARCVQPPTVETLVELAGRFWQEHLPGRAWIMPMSHWAYELDFGSSDWMPAALEHIGIDPGLLQNRNTGAALEFAAEEGEPFAYLLLRLLERLSTSDFMLAFPSRPALCVVHHHRQLWWTSSSDEVMEALNSLVR